ncbi:hypothetical protein CLV51_102371 [Chitinophaga niastensis]|uniref:SprT-like family protein n=1 Tax=Chitinophaga niastensis TaxID=536980 RepID=A0A2P8HMT2_CHINA|nr:hypothetical protein [Chitinophaga niastensis]PSL47514.1 hypothetical protein CLV51_102371 [Chitinophaga niastensis]
MQKKLIVFTAILAVCVITFYACKKQESPPQKTDLITEAKKYFDNNVVNQQKTLGAIESNGFSLDKKTDWNSPNIEKVQSYELVKVPLLFPHKIYYSTDGGKTKKTFISQSFLSMFKNTAGKMVAEVVYKIPSGKSMAGRFDGRILVTDWNGNIKRSYIYNNGISTRSQTSVSIRKTGVKTEGFSCTDTDFYQDVYYGGEYQGTTYLYTKTECALDMSGGGASGGGGGTDGTGGDGPDYSGGGGGGGGASGNYSVKDINDKFKTPCFSSTLAEVRNDALQNTVSKILNNIFGSSDKLNLDFVEANLKPGEDGETDGGSVSGDYRNLTITLNTTDLKNSSKEYVAATILHEVIHGYFRAVNENKLLDHNDMGLFYIDKMAAGIKEVYPTISNDDATALAWGGVHESYAWSELVRKDPAAAKKILDTNTKYKAGTSGIKCN